MAHSFVGYESLILESDYRVGTACFVVETMLPILLGLVDVFARVILCV